MGHRVCGRIVLALILHACIVRSRSRDEVDESGASPLRSGATKNAALAEVSLLLSMFFVGTDVVSIKYALTDLPPLVFVPIRYMLAGLLLLAFLRLRGKNAG